jgi:hypothetical protein
MRSLSRVFAVVLVAITSMAVSQASASAHSFTPTAHELLEEALQASQTAGSLSFVARTTSGKATEVVQGVVSAPAASETVTGLGTPFEIELIGHEVYVHGGVTVLEHSLQLTASQATPLVGKWVSVPPADSAFTSLVSALTITAVLNSFIAANDLRKDKKTTVGGKSVIPLLGLATQRTGHGAKGSATLLVSARKPHLPLGGTILVTRGTHRTREVAVFKDWGATVKLTPPSGAITVLTVLNG